MILQFRKIESTKRLLARSRHNANRRIRRFGTTENRISLRERTRNYAKDYALLHQTLRDNKRQLIIPTKIMRRENVTIIARTVGVYTGEREPLLIYARERARGRPFAGTKKIRVITLNLSKSL